MSLVRVRTTIAILLRCSLPPKSSSPEPNLYAMTLRPTMLQWGRTKHERRGELVACLERCSGCYRFLQSPNQQVIQEDGNTTHPPTSPPRPALCFCSTLQIARAHEGSTNAAGQAAEGDLVHLLTAPCGRLHTGRSSHTVRSSQPSKGPASRQPQPSGTT